MEKNVLTKVTSITSTLFESFVGAYQVCDRAETDDYFKHFLVLIFKDRKPYTIYGIKDKDFAYLLDDITYLYRQETAEKETTK